MDHARGHSLASGGMGMDSLAPQHRDRLRVEDEAALMSRGRGRQLWAAVAVMALIGVSVALVLRVMTVQQQRSDAYGAIRTADDQHAGAFLRCALPAAQTTQLTTSATVLSMIERTSERMGARYASLLGQCATELSALETAVQGLSVPADAEDEKRALRDSVVDMRRAWVSYQTHLDSGAADYVKALPHMEKAALTWPAYTERRRALEDALLPASTR